MKRRDIVLLKQLAYFYSFTGNFPYLQRKGKFVLVVYYVLGIICYLKTSIEYITVSNSSEVGFFISTAILLTSVSFSIVCLRDVFVQKSLWDDIFTDVETFDLMIKNGRCVVNELVCKYYFKIIIFTIIFVLSSIVAAFLAFLFVFSLDCAKVIAVCFHIFTYMQITLTTITIEKTMVIIEKRFTMFKRKLRVTYLFWKPNEDRRNGQQLAASYLLLTNIFGKINELFGQKILIILGLTLLFVLHCFLFISEKYLYWTHLHFEQLINTGITMLILLVSICRIEYYVFMFD